MSAPVFLAEPGTLEGCDVGTTYRLDGSEGRHAAVAHRLAAGERVDVVDGAGVRLSCTVDRVDGAALDLRVLDRVVEPAPAVRLVLVQALAKGGRDELALETATEVGVDAVVPWQARRSVVVWRGQRGAKALTRWRALARAAAKQSRRAWVPEVAEPVDGRALATRVRTTVSAGGLALVLHEEADQPLSAVDLPNGTTADVLVVVGPEGGISPEELAELIAAGGRAVRLGPHVLRTSTAGPVAVALLAERLGRWSGG